MARVILESPGEDVIVGGDDVDVIGTTSGGEEIFVVSGNITLDASFNQGGDTISLPGEAEDYTATFVGSRIILTSAINNVTVSMPVPGPGDSYTLEFREDGDMREVTSNGDGQAVIGDETFDQGETDQLDSNDEETLTEALENFQDAQQALDDFEEENEASVAELNAAADDCDDDLAADRAAATDEELEERRDLEEAEADAADADVEAVDGLPEAIEAYEDAVAAEEAAEERETQANADLAAEEARYNSLNPEDAPIDVRDDGYVYADAGAGDAIIVYDFDEEEYVLTEYGETQANAQNLLEAVQEREDAEAAEDSAEEDRIAAEENLDLIDQDPAGDAEREDSENFENAVDEFNEELAEYRADPSGANAAGLEAAYNQLQLESEGEMPVFVDGNLSGTTADEISANEEAIRDAIAEERAENRQDILDAEGGSNPLTEAQAEERAEADAAQDAVDERNEHIQECEDARDLADRGNALADARDAAADDVQAQGDYEYPETVDGDEQATEGNDLFVAGTEDGDDGTIFDFGEEGNDLLFIGEEYTVVFLEEGTDVENEDVGDNDTLEAFVVQTDDGVMVFLEETAESGNVGDGDFFGPEILLDGLTTDDITVSEGFIMG